MFQIKRAESKQDFLIIEELAVQIWNEHYIPIIGKEQVDYMLDKFQSKKAMLDQLKEGYLYYIMYWENEAVGYLAFKEEEENLFLSKIYVHSKFRGKKIGKVGMDLVISETIKRNKKGIRLTVNKYNIGSINVYKKMGFVVIDEVVTDIGSNYVMDDFVLLKIV